jgi:NAD-reducing hydrogenase large subunit
VAHRNIIGVIQDHPDIARQGVLLRKFGQEVIRVTSGKRIHGSGAIPGGVNKALTAEERDYLLGDADQMIAWAESSVQLMKRVFMLNPDYHYRFGAVDANTLSLVGPDGAFELYHGGLRARDPDGHEIFDHQDYQGYEQILSEEIKSWSYMKFPFITALGPERGWYRVGPLARVNNCDRFDTPLAEQERQDFRAAGEGRLPGTSRARLLKRSVARLVPRGSRFAPLPWWLAAPRRYRSRSGPGGRPAGGCRRG